MASSVVSLRRPAGGVAASAGSVAVRGRSRWPYLALAAVAVGYAALQLELVGTRVGLGWDETVYLSQLDPSRMHLGWSAVRAWGVPVLFAPVAWITPKPETVRLYGTALSALALGAAYWPWIRLVGFVAPVAAFLFATIWVALFYGNEAMPNLYVALGSVAAVALLLHAVRPQPRRWPTLAVGAAGFLVALLRPTDGLVLGIVLVAVCVFAGAWRRLGLLAAVVGGVALGWLPWVVEAYLRFGGLAARLHAGAADTGAVATGPAARTAVWLYLRYFDGPILCCSSVSTQPGRHATAGSVEFAVIPLLVALGLFAAWRLGRLPPLFLAAVTAAAMSFSYLFLLKYEAPRFLLPYYALLALPVAALILWLVRRRRFPLPLLGAGLVAALVVPHLLVQRAITVEQTAANLRRTDIEIGTSVRAAGVRPPCVLIGNSAPPRAYFARCTGYLTSQPQNWVGMWRGLVQRGWTPSNGWAVVAVRYGKAPPTSLIAPWHRIRLHGGHGSAYYAYIAPGSPITGPK